MPNMVEYEAAALRHFGSDICPKVYEAAQDHDALLLERLDVIHDLSVWYPDSVREIQAWLPFLRRIEAGNPAPDGFPTVQEFTEVFDRVLEMPLAADVERLMRVAAEGRCILMAEPGENRLLHGDMHHFNLLRQADGAWKLIDPHGVIGHPYYELGAFLRNPWGACFEEPGVDERLAERIRLLAEQLDCPVEIVARYGFYGAAFSVAWSIEDDGEASQAMVTMMEAWLRLTV